jgi:hypothetical protein
MPVQGLEAKVKELGLKEKLFKAVGSRPSKVKGVSSSIDFRLYECVFLYIHCLMGLGVFNCGCLIYSIQKLLFHDLPRVLAFFPKALESSCFF